MPLRWWRWEIARRMGWTLDYVDSLPLAEWHEYWQIIDGEGKAQAHTQKTSAPRKAARRRR